MYTSYPHLSFLPHFHSLFQLSDCCCHSPFKNRTALRFFGSSSKLPGFSLLLSMAPLNPNAPLYVTAAQSLRYGPPPPPPPPPPFPFVSHNGCYSSPFVAYRVYPYYVHPHKFLDCYIAAPKPLFLLPSSGWGLVKEQAKEPIVIKEVEVIKECDHESEERSNSKKQKKIKGRKNYSRKKPTRRDQFEFQEEKAARNQGSKTTLMIKNIPNKFDKKKVLDMLDEHCRMVNHKLQADANGGREAAIFSEFDFLYLPIDFTTRCNFGYAFVNFTTPLAACRLYRELQHKSWSSCGSGKVCEVTYARIQGVGALLNHFQNSTFFCENGEYRPLHFTPSRNGLRLTNQHYVGKHISL